MIALLLLAAQAAAPAAPVPPAPVAVVAPVEAEPALAPEQRKAAEELVQLLRVDELMRASIGKQIAQMRSGAQLSAMLDQNPAMRLQRSKNPQAWEAAIARIAAKQADAYQSVIDAMAPAAREQAVRAYATNFSLAELHALTVFYRTPLGQTVITRTPAVTEQTMLWAQRELPRRLAPFIAALQPEIARELGPLMPQPAQPPR